jgi:hypothetical protein
MRFVLVTSAVFASIVTSAACAPRHDVFVGWTVDGLPAKDACGQLKDPSVRFQIASRDEANGPATPETATAACADGTGGAKIQTSNFADVVIEVLDGDVVYGRSDPFDVSPGLGGHYEGHDIEELIVANVELERGRLLATLRVVGQSCNDAGAESFLVTLTRKSSPLGTEVIGDPDQVVACPAEGDAIFEAAPVEFGSTYFVSASTTINGEAYNTDDLGTGEGVLIENGLTDLTVDLDVVGRPD